MFRSIAPEPAKAVIVSGGMVFILGSSRGDPRLVDESSRAHPEGESP
jgi:hypothetical protein